MALHLHTLVAGCKGSDAGAPATTARLATYLRAL